MTESISNKKVFVEQLRDGQIIEELFLVAKADRAETKAGNPYLILSLMDRSGEIGGRLWENLDQYGDQAVVGSVAMIKGVAQSFRDELQIKVDSLKFFSFDDPSVELSDFLPSSKFPVNFMLSELKRLIALVTDRSLFNLLEKVFQGKTLEDFKTAPAAKRMHHAYIGGLLEHTLSVASLAVGMAAHYPQLDRDLFLTGALLHDLGKVKEFSYKSVPFEYTDSGRLLGHLVIGAEMVREAARDVSGLTDERLDQLIHMILSHHGRYEFGSPVLPMTIESILLHHIDDIDAKVNFIDKLSTRLSSPGYQWSDYQRPLERFLLLKNSDEDFSTEAVSDTENEENAVFGPEKKAKSSLKERSQENVSKQQTLF